MTPTAQLDGPLRALLQRGQPTPQEVADLMRRYPMQRIAMMQTLQRTLGNSFAGQVTALVQGIDGPVAATSSRVPVPPELSSMKPAVDGAAIEQNASRMADAAQGAIDNARALLPAYTRARNALDKAAIEEIGGTLLATLELVRVANGGTKSQLSTYVAPTQSLPGGDPMAEIDEIERGDRIAGLRARALANEMLADALQIESLKTLTPREYRGTPLEVPAPMVTLGKDGHVDLRGRLVDEIVRTGMVIAETERLFTLFARPGALADQSLRFQARHEIKRFASRPADLAFLRATLGASGLWAELDNTEHEVGVPGRKKPAEPSPFGVGVCTDDGPLSSLYESTKKQAERTGWLHDLGNYDDDTVDLYLRLGDQESLLAIYERLMSASADGRAAILADLNKRGLLDKLLTKLPWAYTKNLHDALPGGHAEVKKQLQKHFLVEGRWGTSLEHAEYHAPSVSKMIQDKADDMGGVGGWLVDKLGDAYNFATLGFAKSYGQTNDLHNAGLMNDEDYDRSMRQIATRTTVAMALMMATAGYGRSLVAPGAAAPMTMASGMGWGAGRTALAAGVEGGTLAGAELMAMDFTDLATGAKTQMSGWEDYLLTILMGGGLAAAAAGTTAWLTSRSSKYLGAGQASRGQQLAQEHPNIAPVMDQIGAAPAGTTVEIRVNRFVADELKHAQVIDQASHRKLADALQNADEVTATIHVAEDLGATAQKAAAPTPGGAHAPVLRVNTAVAAPGAKAPSITPLADQLPAGAVIKQTGGANGDRYVVYNVGGEDRIRFRAEEAKALNEANPGRNRTTTAKAGLNSHGEVFIYEGKHRSIGAAHGDAVHPSNGGTSGQRGVLDYKFEPEVIDDVGVPVKDLKIDYDVPDVPKAEADLMWEMKHGHKPRS